MCNDIKESVIFPSKIISSENVVNADCLLSVRKTQISTSESDFCTFSKKGFILLDFGAELAGSVRILTCSATRKSTVRIRFGESVGEACSNIGGRRNATNNHALRDFKEELVGLSDMTFGNSGFRYVRIDLLTPGDIRIKSIVAVGKELCLPQIYSYNGTDELISRIFDTAKHTVDLCGSGEYIWDGIKRDRLVWIGDMHPEMLALSTLYGRVEKLEKSLDFVAEITKDGEWMNGIVTYSMWWVIILCDYFDKTQCTDFAKKSLPQVKKIGRQLLPLVTDSGELDYKARYLVDWPTSGKPDELSGVRAINIIACNSAIKLLSFFDEDCSEWNTLLGKLRKCEIKPAINKSVLALKYWANGEISDKESELLADGGAKGLSTFFSYYMLKAIAETRGVETAVSAMKDYYGGMLDRGATSFWEDFDIEWLKGSGRIDDFTPKGKKDIHGDFGAYCYVGYRHSLCHGWSSGVIAFIKEYLS